MKDEIKCIYTFKMRIHIRIRRIFKDLYKTYNLVIFQRKVCSISISAVHYNLFFERIKYTISYIVHQGNRFIFFQINALVQCKSSRIKNKNTQKNNFLYIGIE